MSEVSLKAAYGVYMKYAPSNSLDGLLRGVAEGRRQYGPPVDKIFSFIDVNGSVQLFYCQEPGDEQRVHSSPHVKDLQMVYSDGNIGSLSGYLTREFNALRSAEAEDEANRFKIQQPILLEQLGEEIHGELKERRWSRWRTYLFSFNFMIGEEFWVVSGDFDDTKSRYAKKSLDRLKTSLTKKEYECRRWASGGKEECVAYKMQRFSVHRLNEIGKELADLAQTREGCEITWVRVERLQLYSRRTVVLILLAALILLGIALIVWYRS